MGCTLLRTIPLSEAFTTECQETVPGKALGKIANRLVIERTQERSPRPFIPRIRPFAAMSLLLDLRLCYDRCTVDSSAMPGKERVIWRIERGCRREWPGLCGVS